MLVKEDYYSLTFVDAAGAMILNPSILALLLTLLLTLLACITP